MSHQVYYFKEFCYKIPGVKARDLKKRKKKKMIKIMRRDCI